jgi:hypothetical protein
MASSEPATKKLKLPTLADAGQTLGAADAFLESLPEAQSSTSAFSNGGGNNANGLAFGSCHLPPRLLLDTFPAGPMRPDAAAQLLRDFRALDSRPSLNVASFVTTQVEPECRELMAEALTINYIDEEEYPSTAQIHNQCVAQLGDLLSAEKDEVGGENGAGGKGKHCGTSTVGSSEAILLCYLAMKRRWQERRKAAGLPVAGVQCSVVRGEERRARFFLFCFFFTKLGFFFRPRHATNKRRKTRNSQRAFPIQHPPPPPPPPLHNH